MYHQQQQPQETLLRHDDESIFRLRPFQDHQQLNKIQREVHKTAHVNKLTDNCDAKQQLTLSLEGQ
jgi:hypothetical protein